MLCHSPKKRQIERHINSYVCLAHSILNTQHTYTLHWINKFIVNAMQFSHLNAIILGNGFVVLENCSHSKPKFMISIKLYLHTCTIQIAYEPYIAVHRATCTMQMSEPKSLFNLKNMNFPSYLIFNIKHSVRRFECGYTLIL